ncbi:MAG: hypothetical protein HYR80_10215 [Nitrospirae bacterium]|nr:hypothetical protein [Nitrospirota bacterium]
MYRLSLALILFVLYTFSQPLPTLAHGIVGQRFFPATLAVDDPFVADEMDLLGYAYLPSPEPADATHTLSQTFKVGVSKRLTRDLGLELSAAYLKDSFDGADSVEGFDNLAVAVKYILFKSPAHEFITASSLDFDLGGTGTRSVSDPFTTLTPNLFFGYGFGDLPDSMQYFRPFAITGQGGLAVPITDGSSNGGSDYSTSLNYGFTVMYNTMYLQSFVKDIGLPKPFSRTIPLVEFSFTTPINGPNQYLSPASYAYPGFLWIGKVWELGVEAIVPINSATGSQTGVQFLVHLFLDDLAPDIFTRSLSGEILGPTQAK